MLSGGEDEDGVREGVLRHHEDAEHGVQQSRDQQQEHVPREPGHPLVRGELVQQPRSVDRGGS